MTEPSAEPRSFRRRGLGRGLEALLAPHPEEGADEPTLVAVDPRSVEANPEQPRRTFTEEDLAGLAESIRLHGLLHPIVVQREGAAYRLVAGERRLRAAAKAGVAAIPAIVRPPAESARQWLEMALTENLQRSDLNPMEEAAAYGRLADAFGLSHEAIAMRLGRSRSAVSNSIRLLGLPASVQEAVADGRLSAGHARAILAAGGVREREALAEQVAAKGLSVRDTERLAHEGARGPATDRPGSAAAAPGATPDQDALRRGFELALGLPARLERTARGRWRLVIEIPGDDDLDGLYHRLGGRPL